LTTKLTKEEIKDAKKLEEEKKLAGIGKNSGKKGKCIIIIIFILILFTIYCIILS
jgi:hypothetical protein